MSCATFDQSVPFILATGGTGFRTKTHQIVPITTNPTPATMLPIIPGLCRHNLNNSLGLNSTATTLVAAATTVGSTAAPALMKIGTTAKFCIVSLF
ncbi:MAG TPA: hypothetical protein VGN88_00825 [Phycisphaerae bacterium]|jgi:hypothetical protein